MIRYENECVGPCPQGCMGSCCPNRHVLRVYCDVCGEEIWYEDADLDEDYHVCEYCKEEDEEEDEDEE